MPSFLRPVRVKRNNRVSGSFDIYVGASLEFRAVPAGKVAEYKGFARNIKTTGMMVPGMAR